MFFFLSKILFYLAMPILWLTGIFAYAIFTKNLKRRKIALCTGFIIFLFLSNVWICNQMFFLWEIEPTKISELPDYELGIVLTGVTNHDKEPRDRVYFHKGADRVFHTIQLYRLGKIKKILITGGTGRVTGDKISEAIDLQKVFIMCGVPDSALILETDSKNTRENALFSKRVLDSLNFQGKKLLITSAFHMRRSKGCFDKAGVDTDVFPVDYYGGNTTMTPDAFLLPNERALGGWHVLIKEWLGYVTYRFMGYI